MPVYIKTYQKSDKKNDIISFEVETYRQSQCKNITSKNIDFAYITENMDCLILQSIIFVQLDSISYI